MNNSKRTLEIVLAGRAVVDGRVPVSLFSKVIQSVQDIVIQIAQSNLNKDPTKKGRVSSNIKKECELFLTKTEPGSYTARMELPKKSLPLFPERLDFAEEALKDTKNSLSAIADEDIEGLNNIIPNPIFRRRILEKVTDMLPPKDSDYRLEVRYQKEPPVKLIRTKKESIALIEALPVSPPEEALVTQHKVVEAQGLAEVRNGNITKWIETYDIAELEFDFENAWTPKEIKAEGKLFKLAHPIACTFQKQEGLFVSEFKPLGIIAYGETHQEVIQAISQEFAILWQGIVQKPNSVLTEDAKILKEKLQGMVLEAKPYVHKKD